MAHQEVELILTRQLANYLAVPIFMVGADESLLFYNEAAGVLLGRPYDEAGQMLVEDLASVFQTMSEDGSPMPPERLPVTVALRERRPAHGRVRYRALDGVPRTVEVTAFPIEGHAGRHLGAVAVFWEVAAA
jgi:PAS domain-containing protein